MFNLRDLREYEDEVMKKIAEKIGVSKSAYAKWEEGVSIIPLKRLISLANAYNTNIDYLLNLSKNRRKNMEVRKINKHIISLRLKELRKQNNIMQKDLAKELHITPSLLSNYEKEKILISTSFLYELCKKYSISADYLLGFSEENIIQ